MLQSSSSQKPEINQNNLNEINNHYYNNNEDNISVRNEVFVDAENANDSPQLRRSVSELPRTLLTNTPDESPVTLRRQPGRFATNYGNPSVVMKRVRSNQSLSRQDKYVRPQDRRGKSMLLQLVLPVNGINSNLNGDSNNSPGSYADISGYGYPSERYRHPSSSVYSLQESPRTDINPSITSGVQSKILRQRRSPTDQSTTGSVFGHGSPSSPKEKKRVFRELSSKTVSMFYALFIVAMGLALYIKDALVENRTTAEYFSVILVLMALVYVLFLIIDIHFYKKRKEKFQKIVDDFRENSFEIKENFEGQFQVDVVIPDLMKKSVNHDYCFTKDKHSSNFFLKVGAVAFCIGHLIHSGLLLGYQIFFLTSEDDGFFECASVPTLIMDMIYPAYSLFLLFFLFKYSNVVINRYIILARFGIMHCLSASICFWLWTIIREIMEGITFKKVKKENDSYEDSSSIRPFINYLNISTDDDIITHEVDIKLMRFTRACDYNNEQVKSIYGQISPYLFPFSVEFSILIVSIWYLMWQNIGICRAEGGEDAEGTTQCINQPSEDAIHYTESNVVIHADCQSSNKGLFFGLMVIVLTIVNCILFFISVFMSNRLEQGLLINNITNMATISLMIVICSFGYRQIVKLDINIAHHGLLDEFLLFICIPAYFINGIVSAAPAISYENYLDLIIIILEVFQVLLQTMFIIDGIRRCSNTRMLRKTKPGREIVTFLVLVNIAMWISQTFQVKSSDTGDYRYDYYGKELWTILGHMCLPLMMFFRFHSAVCFGDIWKYAYEPSTH